MKVERNTPARATSRVGAAAYAQRSATAAPVETAVPAVSASFLGIPENEFTPRVRDAIMMLLGEVDSLRRELGQAQRRVDEMEKAVDQDQLLPILNRRAFVRELTRHIAVTGRYNTPTSLVYFDLNGFKELNDTHGHAAGDAALAHFADVLLANVRDTD
jgi:PleD family two-component response regulator